MKNRLVLLLILLGTCAQAQESYIGRLWNRKQYEEILTYAPKGQKLSGRDNVVVARTYLLQDDHSNALKHLNYSLDRGWDNENVYFFRAQAYRGLGQYNNALQDLETCLELRPNHQTYMLHKADVAYESGQLSLAFNTYEEISELYKKQRPNYMMAVILMEQRKWEEAEAQIDRNLKLFKPGKEFWTMSQEQMITVQWKYLEKYKGALMHQGKLLEYFPDNAEYLQNELILLRINGFVEAAQQLEEDIQQRYNTNRLPMDYYKSGTFIVAEFGDTLTVRYFRPHLYRDTVKYRITVRDSVDSYFVLTGKLLPHELDTTLQFWYVQELEGGFMPGQTDTTYEGLLRAIAWNQHQADTTLLPTDSLQQTDAFPEAGETGTFQNVDGPWLVPTDPSTEEIEVPEGAINRRDSTDIPGLF